MAALPRTFASFKTLQSETRHESKPVTALSLLRPVPSRQPSLRPTSWFGLAKEPEDARITGGTRSLDRRLLALNLRYPRLAGIES